METKQIKEGDYIRGFKAKDSEFLIDKKYIGAIAEVIEVSKYVIQVQFSDGKTWFYDIEQAIEHLCNYMKDIEKGLDANAKDSMKALDTLVIDKTIAEMLQHPENFMKDNINPDHYKSKSKETIERLQDNLTQGEFKGYLKGNILKYLDRFEYKNGVEDLRKAQWYLNKLIELENG
jgi:antitoxin component YwqK of YwqJK toxin-antitoxin module